ncbi:hypothetical protein LWC34_25055 [Kibdelosporangium philippinense]|uniref:Uncharacterized protein n=1 Tax=Kibdelosporangium philippinense TaxID=211113 RepID=A0ABS8ZHX7_9PSEU|nr:hypothetical protein [Kibdelosporangium philippinense]MCE7006078.1 hypothetical protein [Kibdelosporangium philippinense]
MDRVVGGFVVLAPVVLVAAVVHIMVGRRMRGPARVFTETAILALLATVLMYAWGAWHMFAWDIEETCTLAGQSFEPRFVLDTSMFPLSKKCNADYDLVPSYVNPAVIGLFAVTVLFTILALYKAFVNRKSLDSKG